MYIVVSVGAVGEAVNYNTMCVWYNVGCIIQWLSPLGHVALLQCYMILTTLLLQRSTSSYAGLVTYKKVTPVGYTAWLHCVNTDNEQQEILELIMKSLSEAELYYLRALLMVSVNEEFIQTIIVCTIL